MKRRNFIQLGMVGLAGCAKGRQENSNLVKAGPFVVRIPETWSKTAIVEKVPIQPLFNRENYKLYQKDNQYYSLKASYNCRPQHWALRFPAALPTGIPFDRKTAGDEATAPQILIHKADEWRLVLTDGEHEEIKVADVLSNLRKNMEAGNSPAFMDASQTFHCLKRRIDFSGGHGNRLVTQWTIEPELMKLGQLHYLFLGMSDDNTCQIIATFPLNLPGLPKPDAKNHLGWSTDNYTEFSKKWSEYIAEAEKWLENHENEITPSLRTLDGVMQSLVASRWE